MSFGFEGPHITNTDIKVLFQFLGVVKQSIGDRNVFFLDDSVSMKESRLVLLQELLTLTRWKSQSHFAGGVEAAEHMPIQRGVRVCRTLPLDAGVCSYQLSYKASLSGAALALLFAATCFSPHATELNRRPHRGATVFAADATHVRHVHSDILNHASPHT